MIWIWMCGTDSDSAVLLPLTYVSAAVMIDGTCTGTVTLLELPLLLVSTLEQQTFSDDSAAWMGCAVIDLAFVDAPLLSATVVGFFPLSQQKK